MKEKSKNIFENSKEGTIGARIRVLLLDYDDNISALEDAGDVGNGTLKTWKDKDLDYSTTVLSNFRRTLNINPVWWETGKGDIYLSNITDMQNSNENKENGLTSDVLKNLQTVVEGHTEYLMVPKSILKDTRLVSVDELDKKNATISWYQGIFGELLENMELQPKTTDPKKVQKKS